MKDEQQPTGKVFISYAREDEDLSRRLYKDLKKQRVEVWLDKECLMGGEDFDLAIRKAIESCRFFLLILSETSVNKTGYINKEIRKAIDVFDTFPEGARFIIPVRKNECEPTYERLSRLHYVDLFPDYDEGLRRILRSLGRQQESLKFFPDDGSIQKQIREIDGLRTYYVTALGDLVILSQTHEYKTGWSDTTDRLIHLEWDFINGKYKGERLLEYGRSHAQYYMGGGTDEYHDEKINNLHFDYATNLLSWDKLIRDEEENEWTNYHEVINEQVQRRVYDPIRRKFVEDIVCPKCGAVISGK